MNSVPSNRREFLQDVGAAGLGALAASATCALAADDPATGFVDAHSHIWTTDLAAYPLADGQTVEDLKPRSFTAEELLATAHANGVTRVVLIQHKPYHGLDNSYITDSIAKYPGVFSAVGCIEAAAAHPERDMDRLKELGVRGFRIRPGEGGADEWIDSPGMRAMWEHGAEAGLAMCPLIDPEYIPQVAAMCRRYPDTTVVVDHFARIGMAGPISREDLNNLVGLARFKHTHVKISAFYALGEKRPPYTDLLPMIRTLYDAYGADRLMWGSDSPYQLEPPNTYAASVALVRDRLDFLSGEDRDWLTRKTAEKVFFS